MPSFMAGMLGGSHTVTLSGVSEAQAREHLAKFGCQPVTAVGSAPVFVAGAAPVPVAQRRRLWRALRR